MNQEVDHFWGWLNHPSILGVPCQEFGQLKSYHVSPHRCVHWAVNHRTMESSQEFRSELPFDAADYVFFQGGKWQVLTANDFG